MGCLCSCLQAEQPKGDVATATTPLLTGPASSATEGASSGQSARQIKPKRKEFLTSLEELHKIECGKLPIPALDKTFQDHSKLYNDLLECFNSLKEIIHDFKAIYEYDTNGIPVLENCIKLLGTNCGGATLTASRTKYSIRVEYDKLEVSRRCKGAPEDTLEALELFNKANKNCKSILEKAPKVKNSIQVVLDEEQGLRREVSKANIPGSDEPEVMKVCVANINKLRKLPGSIETIQKHTQKQFNEIKECSKVLFTEP